jgi:hypothetical protein
MQTSNIEPKEFAQAINVHKAQNPDSISLPVKYDEAIKGVSIEGHLVYDFDELVSIYLDENSEAEDEFDSWEDFYDWAGEILIREYNHNRYGLNDLPPIFIHTHL